MHRWVPFEQRADPLAVMYSAQCGRLPLCARCSTKSDSLHPDASVQCDHERSTKAGVALRSDAAQLVTAVMSRRFQDRNGSTQAAPPGVLHAALGHFEYTMGFARPQAVDGIPTPPGLARREHAVHTLECLTQEITRWDPPGEHGLHVWRILAFALARVAALPAGEILPATPAASVAS